MSNTPSDLSDSDFVDRIFDYLCTEFPQLQGMKLEKAKRAIRAEFAGGRAYVAVRTPMERQRLATEILALFNGRNAREVARRLGIGRATVYRHLKQAGVSDRLTFGGNGTATAVRSAASTASPTSPPQEPEQWPSPLQTSRPSMPPSPAESSPSPATDAPSPTAA